MPTFFLFPSAFIAVLIAIPALLALYFLHSRSKTIVVSTLMFWIQKKEKRKGGLQFQRLYMPLLFFLELMIILLLITAASGPMVVRWKNMRPLVVILDDSASMLAQDEKEESARNKAIARLQKEILSEPGNFPIRWILASEVPTLVGQTSQSAQENAAIWEKWKCRASTSDVGKAVAFAHQVGLRNSRILVISDQKPSISLEQGGNLQWWAFGSKQPNVGFVNASRSGDEEGNRCLLEIANFSSSPSQTILYLSQGSSIQSQALELGPGERRSLILLLSQHDLKAMLAKDKFSLDNEVILLPCQKKKPRVNLQIRDPAIASLLQKTLEATQMTNAVQTNPHLIFSDQDISPGKDTWLVKIVSEKENAVYIGPFIVDMSHPLTEGISLAGIVWAAGKEKEVKGYPVIAAGNVPLLLDSESVSGRHEILFRLRFDLSNLQNSPNWPILIANLLEWRSQSLPGISIPNVRLGTDVILGVESGTEFLEIMEPDQTKKNIPVFGRTMVLRPTQAGLHQIFAKEDKILLSCNFLCPEESNLLSLCTGEWGNWKHESFLNKEYNNISWIFLLLALVTLFGTMVIIVFYSSFQ